MVLEFCKNFSCYSHHGLPLITHAMMTYRYFARVYPIKLQYIRMVPTKYDRCLKPTFISVYLIGQNCISIEI